MAWETEAGAQTFVPTEHKLRVDTDGALVRHR